MQIPSQFSERLRIAIAAAHETRGGLAKRCGVTRQAVQKWIDGDGYPSSAKLMIICDALNVSLDWLMHQGPDDLTVPALPGRDRIEAGAEALIGYYSREIKASEPERWAEACRSAERVWRSMVNFQN